MRDDAAVIARLRGAGCVFAEEEAALIACAARTPAELDDMVGQRVKGLPLEQVIGWAEFRGMRIFVAARVFVPRRRSEFLVEVAAGLARERDAAMSPVAPAAPSAAPSAPELARVIVDLCCGTGALGLAVASELGGAELHAADLDPAAVACARRNVGPAGGHVYGGDLFDPIPPTLRGRVNVLICNAPYVPSAEIAFLPAEARDHEPLVALDGGLDGLSVLRRAAREAPGWLAPGGVLLVETSEHQAAEMASAMRAAGLVARVHTDDECGATVITGSVLTSAAGAL